MNTPPATWRHTPLSERITLATDADQIWRPGRGGPWSAWRDDVFDDETVATYRALRRSCEGKLHLAGVNDLKHAAQIGYAGLIDALDDLALAGLIAVRRNRRGAIIAITVNEVPPVPTDIDELRLRFTRNRPRRARSDDVARFVEYWKRKWMKLRGVAYHGQPAKDRAAVRGLLDESYTVDELKRLAWYLLRHGVGADILPRAKVSISTFASNIDRIALEKKADEEPGARIR